VALRWEPTHVTKHSPRIVPLQSLAPEEVPVPGQVEGF